MAQEDNNILSGLNSGMLNSLLGDNLVGNISDSIDLETLKTSADEINELIQNNEEANKQSMKDILTDLQSVTADKAVLSESFNALENLSFKDLIGKPLQAAIDAQADAALSTLEFVKQLCVQSNDGNQQVAVVSFEFFRNGKKARINLPLLSLVNIPSLEIKSMTYKFSAKIDSHSSLIVSHNTPIKTSSASATTPKATDSAAAKNKKENATTEAPKEQESDNATQAVNVKNSVSKETTLAASYTAQTGSSATKDSKYAVHTTMDIDITVEPDEIPGGIKTMLSILDNAIEIINPNGELTVATPQVVIQNGYAIASVSYRDPNGICAPGSITCKGSKDLPTPQIMLSADGAKIIFTKPGLYIVSADKVSEPIIVTGAATESVEQTQ